MYIMKLLYNYIKIIFFTLRTSTDAWKNISSVSERKLYGKY